MAIEITFGVRGKETTQALFIQESEWEISLSRLRRIIEEQSLHVPLEYKFLTLKDNAISHPAEEAILLKEVVCFTPSNREEDTEPKLEDFGMTSEIGEAVKKTLATPKIWITPLKVTFSSTCPNPNSGTQSSGTNATGDADDEDAVRQGQGEDEPLIGGSSNAQQQDQGSKCMFCPYKIFKDFLHGRKGPPDPKTVLKVLFLLTFILFTLLLTLTLSLHLMLSTVIGISRNSGMVDLFSKVDGGTSDSSEIVANLQVKVSQLEMSSKFEIDQLTTKLAELEDLYLNDLAIHKRELNLIKKQMAMDIEEEYADEEMENPEELRRIYERNSKEPKRKSGGGKINDRVKG